MVHTLADGAGLVVGVYPGNGCVRDGADPGGTLCTVYGCPCVPVFGSDSHCNGL